MPAKKAKIVLTCETCGQLYERHESEAANSRYCSRSCQGKAPNPDRRSGYDRTCWYCGDNFYAPQCHDTNKKRTEERAFCSRACFVAYNRVELPCEQCGSLFVVQRHRMDAARFCKHSCYAVWLSENQCGVMHPNWRGGWEPYYGSDWPRQRKACRERDVHTCRVCGATAEQVGSENIDVHHRVPFRVSHDNSLGNLVTLCDPCHHAVEAGRMVCPDA